MGKRDVVTSDVVTSVADWPFFDTFSSSSVVLRPLHTSNINSSVRDMAPRTTAILASTVSIAGNEAKISWLRPATLWRICKRYKMRRTDDDLQRKRSRSRDGAVDGTDDGTHMTTRPRLRPSRPNLPRRACRPRPASCSHTTTLHSGARHLAKMRLGESV